MSTQLPLLIKNSKYKMLNFFMTRAEIYGELKKVRHFEWKSIQKPCSWQISRVLIYSLIFIFETEVIFLMAL